MSGGTVNLTKFLTRPGLDTKLIYEAEVVDNNDPRKLGRIRARIKGVFDGIKDKELPWAVPCFQHCDGGYNPGGDALDRSGTFYVPKKKHKIGLRFPTGEPYKPIWGEYTVDEQIQLPEAGKNYPDRAVFKFSNGMWVIIDTKTNEVFFNNPGDWDITILGDVNQYIVGNQQCIVTDKMKDIDDYLLNAPETVLNRLTPKPAKEIEFQGLLKKTRAGNRHVYVEGDQTMEVKGDRKIIVHGNEWIETKKNRRKKVSLLDRTEAQRIEHNG
jgi:hypothetical protein